MRLPQKFRFTTRVQRLNSIEAASRAKMTFLEQLYRYHHQVGNTRVAVPTINNKPLDLWLLRKMVEENGGFETVRFICCYPCPLRPTWLQVNKGRKWADLGRMLGHTGIPGLSTQIKNAYTRIILPFEEFHRHVRTSSALANVSTATRDPTLHTHAPRPAGASGSGAPAASALEEDDAMSGLSDLDEPRSSKPPSRTRRSTRGASLDRNPRSFRAFSLMCPQN
jgi:histone demethylase JARID1